MMDRDKFKTALQKLGDNYGAKFPINQRIFDLWYKHVGAIYRDNIIENAIDRFIDTSTFAPVIADIKRLCDEQMAEFSKENVYIDTQWSFITGERPTREDTPLAKQYFMEYLSRFDNRLEQSRTVMRWVKEYKGGKTLEELMKQLCEK